MTLAEADGDRTAGPALVTWNVTWRCDLRCAHCYLDAAGRAGVGELSTEEGSALIEDLARLSPGALLVLSGGEPLTRRDLPLLASHARARGLAVVVATNGSLLDDRRAAELAASGVLGVGLSLDSLDPSRHDRFRGVPGSWRRVVRALDAARGAGLAVQLQTTVTRENDDEIPAIADWAAARGVQAFGVFFLVCTGRAQRLSDVAPERYEELLRWIAGTGGRWRGMTLRARCAPHIRRIAAQMDGDHPLLAEDASACLAARAYARVTPDGDVTPCPYLPLTAGNLRERPLSEIWRTAPLFASLRAGPRGGRCGGCEFSSLCGGCRARAYATTGDVLGDDAWCLHRPLGGAPPGPAELPWAAEAEERLAAVPAFVRRMVRRRIEARARAEGQVEVTADLLRRVRATVGHPGLARPVAPSTRGVDLPAGRGRMSLPRGQDGRVN